MIVICYVKKCKKRELDEIKAFDLSYINRKTKEKKLLKCTKVIYLETFN